jgi:hypothetical protein
LGESVRIASEEDLLALDASSLDLIDHADFDAPHGFL